MYRKRGGVRGGGRKEANGKRIEERVIKIIAVECVGVRGPGAEEG